MCENMPYHDSPSGTFQLISNANNSSSNKTSCYQVAGNDENAIALAHPLTLSLSRESGFVFLDTSFSAILNRAFLEKPLRMGITRENWFVNYH